MNSRRENCKGPRTIMLSDGFGHLHSVDFARQEFDALSAFSLRHVVWQRVIRGAGRFKVRNLIGHGFCCILFELALSLVSYRTATPCWRVPIRTKQLSTVAALFCRFLSGCCLAKSTLSRSISLAVCVTVFVNSRGSSCNYVATDWFPPFAWLITKLHLLWR